MYFTMITVHDTTGNSADFIVEYKLPFV